VPELEHNFPDMASQNIASDPYMATTSLAVEMRAVFNYSPKRTHALIV